MIQDRPERTISILQKAMQEGAAAAGVAKAQPLVPETENLRKWISAGMHGRMKYISDNVIARSDPSAVLPGVKSVICMLFPYHSEPKRKSALNFALCLRKGLPHGD